MQSLRHGVQSEQYFVRGVRYLDRGALALYSLPLQPRKDGGGTRTRQTFRLSGEPVLLGVDLERLELPENALFPHVRCIERQRFRHDHLPMVLPVAALESGLDAGASDPDLQKGFPVSAKLNNVENGWFRFHVRV